MTGPSWTLYTAPGGRVDADLVRRFIADQVALNLLTESRTLELKQRRNKDNVVRTIAAFANTEGGIILLGVDEDEPDFDRSPGVPAQEALAVVDQCRDVLEPAIDLESIPVAIPGRDRVIVVIRVEPAGADVPVVIQGRVLVRLPGQNVSATRFQILALLQHTARRDPTMLSLGSRFAPTTSASEPERPAYDALIRVAGAVWLRPMAAAAFVLGRDEREALMDALKATAFVRQLAWRDRPYQEDPWDQGDRSPSRFTTARIYGQEHDRHKVSINSVVEDRRVGFCLDLYVRLRDGQGDKASVPRLGRAELAAALIGGIEAVSLQLPGVVAACANDAPTHVDDVFAWVIGDGVHLSSRHDRFVALQPAAGQPMELRSAGRLRLGRCGGNRANAVSSPAHQSRHRRRTRARRTRHCRCATHA